MKIRPLHDRVVVRRATEETITAGGIVIPEFAASNEQAPVQGEVIAVGPGKISNNGQKQPMSVKIGDKVLFGKYAGTEININNKKHNIMHEKDILGVIE